MKLLAEMTKIAKRLKCLKLRYSVDFNNGGAKRLPKIFNLQSSIFIFFTRGGGYQFSH